MKPLFTEEHFNKSKSRELLPLECLNCKKEFLLTKHKIKDIINPNSKDKGLFCSIKCCKEYKQTNANIVSLKCKNCNTQFSRHFCHTTKSENFFCGKSCAATFNNKNKKYGCRISKLELFIQKNLLIDYPNLEFRFNQKEIISSELDIYVPFLNLAFEINGIFHYKPIYGIKKLQQIQKNDLNKIIECQKNNISLIIIDITSQKSDESYLIQIKECIDNSLRDYPVA